MQLGARLKEAFRINLPQAAVALGAAVVAGAAELLLHRFAGKGREWKVDDALSGVAQVFFIGILATGLLEGLRRQRWHKAEFAALNGFAATAHLAASGSSERSRRHGQA